MKKTIVALAIFAGATLSMNAQKAIQAEFKTPADTAGYYVGYSIGKNLNSQGLSSSDLNLNNLLVGLHAAMKEDKALLTDEQFANAEKVFTALMQSKAAIAQAKQAEAQAKAAGPNKAEGEKFLAENKKKEGVKTTASGLQYKVITKGAGTVSPKATDKVKVHYTGKLISGKTFDSSVERGQPAEFGLNQVIKGWTEGVQLMHTGDKFQFYIPSDLAYGDRQMGEDIKPGMTLIFDVELLEINPVDAK